MVSNKAGRRERGIKMSATKLAVETIENTTRTWYAVIGHDAGTNLEIDGEYAICEDGRVLNCYGYPISDCDLETIAVRNLIG